MAPEDRPTFKNLYLTISNYIEHEAGYLQLGQNPFAGSFAGDVVDVEVEDDGQDGEDEVEDDGENGEAWEECGSGENGKGKEGKEKVTLQDTEEECITMKVLKKKK